MDELIDLGWCMAKISAKTNDLKIFSPSNSSDGFFEPSSQIWLSAGSIIKLRDALNRNFPVTV